MTYRNLRLLWVSGSPPGRSGVACASFQEALERFWRSRKDDSEIAERDFTSWLKLTRNAEWAHFGALRQTFGTADQVGNCVVFDVGNNRFRLIGRVNYRRGIVYVLRPMDHAEYDKKRWVDDCGCYKPAPMKPTSERKAPPEGKPKPSGRKGGS